MNDSARYALDPQTEAETVDAIVTLDWSVDPVSEPLRIIKNRFAVEEDKAIDLFLYFQRQNLMVCKPRWPANNLGETGRVMQPMQSRWIRPDEETR